MQYRLNDNLGLIDARKCNQELGTSLPLVPSDIAKGSTVNLTDAAFKYLNGKYKGLLEPAGQPIKAPAVKPGIVAEKSEKQ